VTDVVVLERKVQLLEEQQKRDREAADRTAQVMYDHLRRCETLGKENTELIREAIRKSDENASACIRTAEGVRSKMQLTMLGAAGGTILVLLTAIEFMLNHHG
jgi:hypothetical protein